MAILDPVSNLCKAATTVALEKRVANREATEVVHATKRLERDQLDADAADNGPTDEQRDRRRQLDSDIAFYEGVLEKQRHLEIEARDAEDARVRAKEIAERREAAKSRLRGAQQHLSEFRRQLGGFA